MDHTEFKQYLSRLEGLSPAQKRKLSDVLRVKDKGELVGEIRFAQKMLKQSPSPKEELFKKTAKELKTLLDQLEKQFTV